MKYVIFILMLISIWVAPSAEAQNSPGSVGQDRVVAIPRWLHELPEGDFTIGISHRERDVENMQAYAKQHATISKSRNDNSICIIKYTHQSSDLTHKDAEARFEINVSASPDSLMKIYEALELVDNYNLYENFVGIYSKQKRELSDYHRETITPYLDPQEFSEPIIEKDTKVESYSTGSSTNLIRAWDRAAEVARNQLAAYVQKNVQSFVGRVDEKMHKDIAIETSIILGKMRISKSIITMEMVDNLLSYVVYLKIEMERD